MVLTGIKESLERDEADMGPVMSGNERVQSQLADVTAVHAFLLVMRCHSHFLYESWTRIICISLILHTSSSTMVFSPTSRYGDLA